VAKGAQGIVVSNYGGFYVDGAPATMEVLPSIAEAVNGRVPVLVDGGFRRGTDILKALALGANAVMIGRPVLWGLAGYGPQGVQKVLELLQTELALAMGLSGITGISGIHPSLVKVHRRV
jgi:isopentenyl diphosphate isomerase/L-lactate dehydrogenase-like FMN-dependent dehydrogenase